MRKRERPFGPCERFPGLLPEVLKAYEPGDMAIRHKLDLASFRAGERVVVRDHRLVKLAEVRGAK